MLVCDREKVVLGAAEYWWSGGVGMRGIFCVRAIVLLKELDGRWWESECGRYLIGGRQSCCVRETIDLVSNLIGT